MSLVDYSLDESDTDDQSPLTLIGGSSRPDFIINNGILSIPICDSIGNILNETDNDSSSHECEAANEIVDDLEEPTGELSLSKPVAMNNKPNWSLIIPKRAEYESEDEIPATPPPTPTMDRHCHKRTPSYEGDEAQKRVRVVLNNDSNGADAVSDEPGVSYGELNLETGVPPTDQYFTNEGFDAWCRLRKPNTVILQDEPETTQAAVLEDNESRKIEVKDMTYEQKVYVLNQLLINDLKSVEDDGELSPFIAELKTIKSPSDACSKIYELSKKDYSFWRAIKRYTLGNNSSLRVIRAKTKSGKRAIAPAQCGGQKGLCEEKNYFVPAEKMAMGYFGERWVGKNILEPWLVHADASGKICSHDVLVLTTTPDYTIHNGVQQADGAVISFPMGGLTGVVEVKSSELTKTPVWDKDGFFRDDAIWKNDDVNVTQLFCQKKPRYLQSSFMGGTQRVPIWLPKERRDLFERLQREIQESTRWYLAYDDEDEKLKVKAMDMSDPGNQLYLRTFSTDQSQQMFCECLSVEAHGTGDTVTLVGAFPSLETLSVDIDGANNIIGGDDAEDRKFAEDGEPIDDDDTPVLPPDVDTKYKFKVAFCVYFHCKISRELLREFNSIIKPILVDDLLDLAESSGVDLSQVLLEDMYTMDKRVFI